MVSLGGPSGGNPAEAPGVQSAEAAQAGCFVALGTPSTTIIQQCSPDDLARMVLRLLEQQARRRLNRG
jgi:hypothetical protein